MSSCQREPGSSLIPFQPTQANRNTVITGEIKSRVDRIWDTMCSGGIANPHHMKDALFMMPTPRVLASVVDQLDGIDMVDYDIKGDLYEYMLGKIASAGQNDQFRTPRHIIKLMVDLTAPAHPRI